MSEKRAIIFLDFDGVLNSPATWGKRRDDAVDRDKVERLNTLVEEFDADIVISSTWRLIYSLDEIIGFLERKGLQRPMRVIGVTPRAYENSPRDAHDSRGFQIWQWLNKSGRRDDPFVVLDDMSAIQFRTLDASVADKLVQTDGSKGLQETDINAARELLTSQLRREEGERDRGERGDPHLSGRGSDQGSGRNALASDTE